VFVGDFSQKSALLLGILAWNLLYGLLFFGVWVVTEDGGEPLISLNHLETTTWASPLKHCPNSVQR
jgi:hypothetical protein